MKVDEQFKCKDCDNYNLCNYYHNRRETSFICKEFQNQWSFIKELERLQEEIQNLIDFNESYDGHTDLYQADELIKKRISELKGDQE